MKQYKKYIFRWGDVLNKDNIKNGMEGMKDDLKENLGGGKFFSFDKMITPAIIKIIFIIGIIFTTLSGLGFIISGIGAYYGGGIRVFSGLIILILGPILVRVYCELMIVVFKIHESLEAIRRR